MLTIFSKKKEIDNVHEVQTPKFASFQRSSDAILTKSDLSELKGGQSNTRLFTRFFSWNSSCGGSVPQ
jgi:hypothetical protein